MAERENDGESVIGERRIACNLKVESDSHGSALTLKQPDGTEAYLYVSDAGKLTIGTRAQWLAATGGTVVGGQS